MVGLSDQLEETMKLDVSVMRVKFILVFLECRGLIFNVCLFYTKIKCTMTACPNFMNTSMCDEPAEKVKCYQCCAAEGLAHGTYQIESGETTNKPPSKYFFFFFVAYTFFDILRVHHRKKIEKKIKFKKTNEKK